MSQQRAGDTLLLSQFAEGNVVILRSLCAGGQNLTVIDGEVEGQKGREDSQAQFRVHVHQHGVIALQSVHNSDWWLAIYERKPVGSGRGGPYCKFYVKDIDGRVVALESVMYPGCNLGVKPDGSGTENHCLFVPYLYSVAPTPPPQLQHVDARLVQNSGPSAQPQPSPSQQSYPGYPQPAQQSYPGYRPPATVPPQPRIPQQPYHGYQQPVQHPYSGYQPPAPVPPQPRIPQQPSYPGYPQPAQQPSYPGYPQPAQQSYSGYRLPAPVPQQPAQQRYPAAGYPQQPPVHQQPAYPGYRQPAPRQPRPLQPPYLGYRQPAPQLPAVLQPSYRQPAPQQPGALQPPYPGYRQPAPGALQPGYRQPAPQQPGPLQPGYQQPAPQQPGALQQPYPGYPQQPYSTPDIPPQQHSPSHPPYSTSSVSPLPQPTTPASTAPSQLPSTPQDPPPDISSLHITSPPPTLELPQTPPQRDTSPTSPHGANLTRPPLRKQTTSPLPMVSQPPPETASPQSQERHHDLERETWYHGGLSREGAEELLRKATNGHFLVRESETRGGVFSLSLKHPGGVKHFRILKNRIGLYEIPGNPSFQSVPELINYFTQNSITVDPHHRLRFPCPRPSATEDVDAPMSHARRHTVGTLPQPPAGPPAPEETQPTAAPLGYNILDLFQPGNILRLIPRADPSSLPIWVGNKKLHGKGTYHSSNSEFQVAVPSHSLVMLKNVHSPACHLCIDKKGHIRADGKDRDDACCFSVFTTEDGNSVLLESHKFPGWYLAVGIGGEVADPKTIGPGSREAHFGVRAEKVVSPHSDLLTTPFQGYSIANQLKDRCIIQLFCKRVSGYLSINKKGSVEECRDEDDHQTFFILHDHGMGIFSLHSHKYPGHLIRMHKHTLEGKGDADISADFRLKETPDGAACFESINCPGMYISIHSTGTQIQGCHFSVTCLTIHHRGKLETITKKQLPVPQQT